VHVLVFMQKPFARTVTVSSKELIFNISSFKNIFKVLLISQFSSHITIFALLRWVVHVHYLRHYFKVLVNNIIKTYKVLLRTNAFQFLSDSHILNCKHTTIYYVTIRMKSNDVNRLFLSN